MKASAAELSIAGWQRCWWLSALALPSNAAQIRMPVALPARSWIGWFKPFHAARAEPHRQHRARRLGAIALRAHAGCRTALRAA